MRDELNVVITFKLALKFAFIVTRLELNFSPSVSFSHATLRHQKLFVLPTWILRFDVSTRTIPHISAGVSLIGSQILIEWSVPDITKVQYVPLAISHVLAAAALTAFSLSTG